MTDAHPRSIDIARQGRRAGARRPAGNAPVRPGHQLPEHAGRPGVPAPGSEARPGNLGPRRRETRYHVSVAPRIQLTPFR